MRYRIYTDIKLIYVFLNAYKYIKISIFSLFSPINPYMMGPLALHSYSELVMRDTQLFNLQNLQLHGATA